MPKHLKMQLHVLLFAVWMPAGSYLNARSISKKHQVEVRENWQRAGCADGFVICPAANKCIFPHWICDGENDCGDLSDEPESCYVRPCLEDDLKCSSGQCISKESYCTESSRCEDGTKFADVQCPDVICDEGYVKCKQLSSCILSSHICDGGFDCGDMSDEPSDCKQRQCSPGEARCDSGQCLNRTNVCLMLGDSRCRDFTRFPNLCENFTCPEGWTKCISDGKCVDSKQLCDGRSQCSDGSDEFPIHCNLPLKCDSRNQFRCRSNRRCISKHYVCDMNDYNCDDNSDEDEAFCRSRTCESNEVRCDNGQCIGKEAFCYHQVRCRDRSQTDTNVCDDFPSESEAAYAEVACDLAFSEVPDSCRQHPVKFLFGDLSSREIYNYLVETDLQEICSSLEQWYGCFSNIISVCENPRYTITILTLPRNMLISAGIAIRYVCSNEINTINRYKACLLKDDETLSSTTEPVPELVSRINQTCSHLIGNLNSYKSACSILNCVEETVAQTVASLCGDEISAVVDGLFDRVQHQMDCATLVTG